MKWLIFALALFSLVCFAEADETDLYGGVLIAHVAPPFDYCFIPPCDYYELDGGIADASEQDNRHDSSVDGVFLLWYVVAAFTSDKTWCGVQFGLGDYNSDVFVIDASGTCLDGHLEIPIGNWPGPNAGTAVVATHTPWTGNYQPVYWFYGYTYSNYYGSTVIPLVGDPNLDFIGLANCEQPSTAWPAEGGAVGIDTDGLAVYPIPPPPLLACCFVGGGCELMLPEECPVAGGWVEDSYSCDPNPCSTPPFMACCFDDGSCLVLLPEDCESTGGYYMEGVYTCDPNPCHGPNIGACCADDGSCTITLEAECAGEWMGVHVECEPDPCEGGTAVRAASWGSIKAIYQ